MTATEQAARWLADVRRYDLEQPDSHMGSASMKLEPGYGDYVEYADALAAIARHLAPGDDLVAEAQEMAKALLKEHDAFSGRASDTITALLSRLSALTAERDEATVERDAAREALMVQGISKHVAKNEAADMRAILATIVSRCDTAKQQCNDGEPVSAFNLASAILGQIGSYRAALTESPADGGSNG